MTGTYFQSEDGDVTVATIDRTLFIWIGDQFRQLTNPTPTPHQPLAYGIHPFHVTADSVDPKLLKEKIDQLIKVQRR